MCIKTLVLLHTIFKSHLHVFLCYALVNKLVRDILLGQVVFIFLKLLVEGEDATLLIENILHF